CKWNCCPSGFFRVHDQCFKYFNDYERSWISATSKCLAEGLVLPQPSDPVSLRSYLVRYYGSKHVWLNGHGDGRYIRWQRGNSAILSSSSFWAPGSPSGRTSTSYCLGLMSSSYWVNNASRQPFYASLCSNTGYYTLCELLR
ncbi:unnamed protein product, partial [Meganyctiphanes norvegica]